VKRIFYSFILLNLVFSAPVLCAKNSSISKKEIRSLEASGVIKRIRKDVWKTEAGLIIAGRDRFGSTRLAHIMKHTENIKRKAVHGVFTISKASVVRLMDRVWKSYRSGNIKLRKSRKRSILDFDAGKRIGYEGGRRGKSRGKTSLRKVRLVLQGRGPRVVTFYLVR